MSWIVEIKFEIDDGESVDILPELLSNLGNGVLKGDNLKSFLIKESKDE